MVPSLDLISVPPITNRHAGVDNRLFQMEIQQDIKWSIMKKYVSVDRVESICDINKTASVDSSLYIFLIFGSSLLPYTRLKFHADEITSLLSTDTMTFLVILRRISQTPIAVNLDFYKEG